MRIKPKHVALFGNFGSDNLGNEASLKAMLDFLRRERPEWQITCVCYGTERAHAEHGVATIPITPPFPQSNWFRFLNRGLFKFPFQFRDFLHALLAVRTFNLLIVPGTGILDDFSERWQAMPYDLFKWSIAARLTRRRFAFVSIGAGPIHHPVSRWLMIWAARLASYRSYRDEASKDYMLALDASGREDPVFPDLVFGLPTPEHMEKKSPDGQPLTIGVGVMHYFGWDRASTSRSQIHEAYISRMTQFVCWLHEHGYRVRLLIGALSDQRSFDDMLRRVAAQCGQPAAEAIAAEPALSFDDLMRQMNETVVIVATRFHNIVAAMKLGLPAISIGYAEKNDILLAQVGLDAFCQPVEQLDVTQLIAQFERLILERDQFAGPIRALTERYRESLEHQEAYLLAQLF
jgi:polysaccharide pyruvyl transferase WcaK-like protein